MNALIISLQSRQRDMEKKEKLDDNEKKEEGLWQSYF